MKIINFSNYEIYPNEGKIWSLKTNKWVGSKNKKTGYWECTLTSDDGIVWKTKVHRVIWTCVNGEIPQGYEVNHRDETTDNNSISNLNLLTHKENMNFGTRNVRAGKAIAKAMKGKHINRKDLSKPVGAYKNGTLIMVFPSTREAGRNGFNQGHIASCCNGKLQSHKGYQWQFI